MPDIDIIPTVTISKNPKDISLEQHVRNMLERAGVVRAQEISAGSLVEIANMMSKALEAGWVLPIIAPRIWWLRDNHTFRQLSNDVDTAMMELREEQYLGQGEGMLWGKPEHLVPEPVHAYGKPWAEFEKQAHKWLVAVTTK